MTPASRPAGPGPSRLALWAPPVMYMAVIFLLSSLSRPPDLGPDSSAHFVEYAGLGLLLTRAFSGGMGRARGGSAAMAWAAASLYGVSDELHQGFVPSRHAEGKDVLMDAIGSGTGAALAWAVGIRQRRLEGGVQR